MMSAIGVLVMYLSPLSMCVYHICTYVRIFANMNAIINDEFRSTKPVSYINVSILRKSDSHLNIDQIK